MKGGDKQMQGRTERKRQEDVVWRRGAVKEELENGRMRTRGAGRKKK